jgi:hypothetical protein
MPIPSALVQHGVVSDNVYVMKKLIGTAAYTYLHTQLGNPIFF